MRFWICLLAFVIMTTLAMAEEPGHVCPSDHAASQGYKAFGIFHEVMAPTWHTAYPAKDFDALVAAGPKFDTLFKGIADIQPTMKCVSRKAAFLNHRETFAQLVKAYADAAKAGLKDSCYALMPSLHDAFENTASMLAPYSYPELEGAMMTAGIILEQHVPNNNLEGITGSTETKWAFPLIVIGMNSIAAYFLADYFGRQIADAFRIHLGTAPFQIFGARLELLTRGALQLLTYWLILFWMYRRKIFLRI